MARIAVLAPTLAGNPAYTAWQFRGALSRRHEVELWGPDTDDPWRPLREELGEAVRLPGANPLSPSVRRAARQAVRGVDLLYAFKAHPASFGLGLHLRRSVGVPLALHLDDWDGGWFADRGLLRRAWYALRGLADPSNELYFRVLESRANSADLLTVSSRALERRFGGTVVRQGVDEERFSPERFPRREARRRLGISPETELVLFLGTPLIHKGLGELLEAHRSLERSSARLRIVGSPPDPEVARAIEGEGGKAVEVRGYVSFGRSGREIAAADVFAVPQRPTPYAEHQLPAKILHAMALGVPVVATDVGDARELLGGSPPAGLVVPPGDPAALRDALGEILDDPERAARLGGEARRRVEERYGWSAMADALETALRERGLVG